MIDNIHNLTTAGAKETMLQEYSKDCPHKLAVSLAHGSVLSIGCGYRREVKELNKIADYIVAIDIDKDAINECFNLNISGEYILKDILDYNFGESRFNSIICLWNTLNYFKPKERRKVIEKAMDLLDENGKFILTFSKMNLKRKLWNIKHRVSYYFTDKEMETYFEGFDYDKYLIDGTYLIILNKTDSFERACKKCGKKYAETKIRKEGEYYLCGDCHA